MNIPRDQLMTMTKEELIKLLELALTGQEMANQNMVKMTKMMEELHSKCETLQAEITVLQSKPFSDTTLFCTDPTRE